MDQCNLPLPSRGKNETLLDQLLDLQINKPSNLSVITAVLSASAGWHTHKLMQHVLLRGGAVIHVSFMHDAAFHQESAIKVGLDIEHFRRTGRYVFIDGLSNLFYQFMGSRPGLGFEGKPDMESLFTQLLGMIGIALPRLNQGGRKVLLVVENPDMVLAAGGFSAAAMTRLMLALHEMVHSTAVVVNADDPLVDGQGTTRLEKEAAAFVMSLVHQANFVTSLRTLDSGTAKDVSGVMRVSMTAPFDRPSFGAEFLYYVGDGNVNVFNKGELM